MSNILKSGFMGIADVGGTKIRCSSFSINPSQDVLFYNHVIGLRDTVPSNSSTKHVLSESSINVNTQRRIWRPSPITISGGIGFPATETSLKSLFNLARYAQYFDTTFVYYCNKFDIGKETRLFKDCRVGDFSFAVKAGDIVNLSSTISAKKIEASQGKFRGYTKAEKIITWDKSLITITNAPFNMSNFIIEGFDFKINNNLQTIHVANAVGTAYPDSLLPFDIRVGMQEVSGDLTVYMQQGLEFISFDETAPTKITINLPNLVINMSVVFQSNQMDGVVGPIITKLPFVGVDKVFS
jgi:hypothetical protein